MHMCGKMQCLKKKKDDIVIKYKININLHYIIDVEMV
jgi:hypothetical protein